MLHRSWKPFLSLLLIGAFLIKAIMCIAKEQGPANWPTTRLNPCQPHADLVFGQPDFNSQGANRTPGCATPDCAGPPAANTISVDDARLAFDSQGRVWLSDKENSRVLRFDPPFENGMNATLVLGQRDFISNVRQGVRTDADTLSGPLGLAFDAGRDNVRGNEDDRLWVVDKSNSRVLRFDPPFESGMRAAVVLGQPDFQSNGENRSGVIGRLEPVANGFANPSDIAIDSSGNLWITDNENDRVLLYVSPINESGPVPGANDSADAVLGQPDFRSRGPNRGSGSLTRRDGFWDPRAIAVDTLDNLWVVDNDNNRVLRYNTPIDMRGPVPGALDNGADVILGQPDFTSNRINRGQRGPVRDGFGQPTGIATDHQDNIWITEGSNNRVVRYDAPTDMSGHIPGAGDDGADLLLGEPDFNSAAPNRGDIAPRSDGFGRPNGVGIGPAGSVWTVEHDNDRVLRFPCSSTGPQIFILTPSSLERGGGHAVSR